MATRSVGRGLRPGPARHGPGPGLPTFHERLEAEAGASREEERLRNAAALPGFDYGTGAVPADGLPIELRPLR